MPLLLADDWTDYELLDCGDGERLERWGPHRLRRPDPQVLWPRRASAREWREVDAHYHRSEKGGGHWELLTKLPESWTIAWRHLRFEVRPTGFKHTGLFPEQAVNWRWTAERIAEAPRPFRLLNLFAYTGAASVAAIAAGAEVVHVDAAKGMCKWAQQNLALSGLADRPARFLVDDVPKLVAREFRRGNRYQGLVLDPPSYGRGAQGEVWKLEDQLWDLLKGCADLLGEDASFLLLNGYTTGISPTVIANLLELLLVPRFGGRVETGEVGLPIRSCDLALPCGLYARWTAPPR
jgi:23S rRNA (cytosine1962-C5)-methyltransferase